MIICILIHRRGSYPRSSLDLSTGVTNVTAMVEWLRCSTRIHRVLCSNLSITIRGMTLDKSLTAQLSQMTHSYRIEYITSQYVGRKRGADTAVCKKKKTIETGCMWILIITAAGPNE